MKMIESAIKSGKEVKGIHASDMSSFMVDRIKGSESALRDAVLAASVSVRMGSTFESAVEDKLRLAFPVGSTVANVFSCARNVVPALQKAKVNLLTIPNLYGMRELKKVIADDKHESHKAVIAGIKAGKSLGKLKAILSEKTPVIKAPVTAGDKKEEAHAVLTSPSGKELRLLAADACIAALVKSSPEQLAETLNLVCKGFAFTVAAKK